MRDILSEVLGPTTIRYRIPVRDKNGFPVDKDWTVSEKVFDMLGRPSYIIEEI